MPRPQTIQIYLPSGDPTGIRTAEITTRIVQVVEVPRTLLAQFLAMPQAQQVAVYFLVGEQGEDGASQVYVGQSGDLPVRLARHNVEKDFWQRALVVLSRTHSLTQTHVQFLEWHCLQEVRRVGRYLTVNGNSASRVYTPLPMEAECLEVFDTARTLTATLGHPLFEPVAKRTTASSRPLTAGEVAGLRPVGGADGGESAQPPDEMFYCTAGGCDARGYPTSEGFAVLAGSSGRRESVESIRETTTGYAREQLIESGVFRVEGDRVVLNRDHLFSSPSSAATAFLGRTANGWIEWRAADGRTLHEVKRAPVSIDERTQGPTDA